MSSTVLQSAPMPNELEKFTQIYICYMPYVLSYFRAYLMDVQQAEDLAQEVFIKVFLHREQLGDIENIPAWLRAIARNTYVDFQRKNSPQIVSLESAFYVSEIRQQVETLDERLDCCELTYELFHIFTDPLDRRILAEIIRGIPQVQIARMLNTPSGTIRSRLYRIRRKLHRALIDTRAMEN